MTNLSTFNYTLPLEILQNFCTPERVQKLIDLYCAALTVATEGKTDAEKNAFIRQVEIKKAELEQERQSEALAEAIANSIPAAPEVAPAVTTPSYPKPDKIYFTSCPVSRIGVYKTADGSAIYVVSNRATKEYTEFATWQEAKAYRASLLQQAA